jgi:hypothetical protein
LFMKLGDRPILQFPSLTDRGHQTLTHSSEKKDILILIFKLRREKTSRAGITRIAH